MCALIAMEHRLHVAFAAVVLAGLVAGGAPVALGGGLLRTSTSAQGQGVIYFIREHFPATYGTAAVYRVNADGTGLQPLSTLTPDTEASGPVLSAAPGGRTIGFVRAERAYFAAPDGSQVRAARTRVGAPSTWSPDGKLVAWTDVDVNGGVIEIASITGQYAKTIRGGCCAEPAWSPKDGRIAFGKAIGLDEANGPQRQGIYSIEPDGSDLRRLAVGGVFAHREPVALRWSPDGTELAVEAGDGLYAVAAADGHVSRLASISGDDRSLAWSPDSRTLAFVSGGGQQPSEIYLVKGDGSDLFRLTRSAGGESSSSPQWSPDGSRIAYVRGRFAGGGGASGDIYVINADGTGNNPLVASAVDGGEDSSPIWTSLSALPATTNRPQPGLALHPLWTMRVAGAGLIAATSSRVAVEVAAPGPWWEFDCGPVILRAARTPPLRSGIACNGPGDLIDSLAIAGSQIAWVFSRWDHSAGTDYLVSTCVLLWKPLRGARLGEPPLSGEGGCGVTHKWLQAHDLVSLPVAGGDVRQLVGNGDTLLYNAVRLSCIPVQTDWVTISVGFSERPVCKHGREPRMRSIGLWKIVGGHPTRVRGAVPAVVLDSFDGTYIAGRETAHDVDVLRLDGTTVAREHLAAQVLGVRLQGRRLIVLTGHAIVIYDLTRRAAPHRIQLPADVANPQLEGVEGDLAVYLSGITIHVLRLKDGHDTRIELPPVGPPVQADLEPSGLFYAYNKPHHRDAGRMSFVSMASLTAALG